MELKQDELVLCTVKKIEGTTVFVNIEEYNLEATIAFSEIAAGRIRNIREYAVPNKKIVCKVLKIQPSHIELSFRRVTGSERDSIIEKYKQEATFKTMLKQIVKNPEEIITSIKEKMQISEFISDVKDNPKLIDEFFNKQESEKLIKILSEKKEKEKEVKKIFILKSDYGIKDIKDILNIKEGKILYLGSSQFSISSNGKDFKEANNKLSKILLGIQNKAKERKAFFELKEK